MKKRLFLKGLLAALLLGATSFSVSADELPYGYACTGQHGKSKLR